MSLLPPAATPSLIPASSADARHAALLMAHFELAWADATSPEGDGEDTLLDLTVNVYLSADTTDYTDVALQRFFNQLIMRHWHVVDSSHMSSSNRRTTTFVIRLVGAPPASSSHSS